MTLRRVVVVGGSVAGLAAVEGLRRRGYDGRLTVVAAEPMLPYDRPPLSKGLLTDSPPPLPPFLRTAEAFEALAVEWRLGCRAVGLDTGARRLDTQDGQISYDALVIATGADAQGHRDVPQFENVHRLRTIDDSRALHAAARSASRVVVVGGGLLGCEVAAAFVGRGLHVTLVDRAGTLLSRSLGARAGALVERLHRDNGVHVLNNSTVSGITTAPRGAARVHAVHLVDGTTLPVGIVVLALGAQPATAWLAHSGVSVDDGVVTDRYGRTTVTGVYAAGDVARPFSAAAGRHERSAHWTAAVTAGDAVAANMLAGDSPVDDVVGRPYFWSDQYGVRVQVVGTRADGDELTLESAAGSARTTGLFSRNGVVTAAFAMNAAGQLPRLSRLVGQPLPGNAPAEARRA
ncbi:MAG: hypothetical protein QOC60_367 [Frankiaceae bacterium]|nr:hypothetical protein [Frankiaceae bacterium]